MLITKFHLPPFDKRKRFWYNGIMDNELNYRQLLIDIRTEHNLSQEELADMLEVSRQTVARWEAGKNNPAANQITRLCKIFNLNPLTYSATLPPVQEESVKVAEKEADKAEEEQPKEEESLSPFKRFLVPLVLIGVLIALSVVGLVITIIYAIKDSQFDTVTTTLIIALPQNTPMVVLSIMLGCFIAALAAVLLYLIRRKDK